MEYKNVKFAVGQIWNHILEHAKYYAWDLWLKVRLELHEAPNPNLDRESRLKVYESNPIEVYERKGHEKPKLIKSD